MKTTKDIAYISVFTALLIGGQFALSFVAGVEVVTVLFLSFAFTFGIKRSILVANAFSILRCLIFGFFPTVLILYIVYYNLFAVVFGFIGNKFEHKISLKKHIFIVIIADILTLLFTLLDDVITPLFYGFSKKATLSYFYMSFTACVPQIICVTITVSILFIPLYTLFKKLK